MNGNVGFQLVDNHSRAFALRGSRIQLGRSSDNQIVVQDSQASRHHATIFVQAGQFYIQDEGSTNGTRLNGKRVAGPQPLQVGDRIRIGNTEFVVQLGAAAPAQQMRGGYAVPARQSSALPYVAVGGVAAATIVFLIVAIALSVRRPVSQAKVVPTAAMSSPVVPSQVIPTPVLSTPVVPSPAIPSPTAPVQVTTAFVTLIPTATPVTLESAGQGAFIGQSRTSTSGEATYFDPSSSRRIKVKVVDEKSSSPLRGIQVTLVSYGSAIMVLGEDLNRGQNQGYHSSLMVVSNLSAWRPSGSVSYLAIPVSQTLGQVNLTLGLISVGQFIQDVKAIHDDWPQIQPVTNNWQYTDRCLTGEQLAHIIGAGEFLAMLPVGALLTAIGVPESMVVIFGAEDLINSQVLPEYLAAKYPRPTKFRFYRWPWDQWKTILTQKGLYEVVGTCESTPTPPPPPPACFPLSINKREPQDGQVFNSRNMALKWWTDYSLKSGESFDVLVWPDGGGARSLGVGIPEKNGGWTFPINDLYAWSRGKYWWTVRVKASNGTYRSCDGTPFWFNLVEKNVPAPAPPSSSSSSSSSSCWSSWHH